MIFAAGQTTCLGVNQDGKSNNLSNVDKFKKKKKPAFAGVFNLFLNNFLTICYQSLTV